MAKKLRANTSLDAQLIILGRLAAALDGDMRHPVDVFEEFFAFTPQDKIAFLRGYNDRDDPIDAVVQ